jgi:hypothetical protein
MLEALRAVEYELPSFDTQLHAVDLAAVARARVEIRLCTTLPVPPTSCY